MYTAAFYVGKSAFEQDIIQSPRWAMVNIAPLALRHIKLRFNRDFPGSAPHTLRYRSSFPRKQSSCGSPAWFAATVLS